jgi:hypothetical protein
MEITREEETKPSIKQDNTIAYALGGMLLLLCLLPLFLITSEQIFQKRQAEAFESGKTLWCTQNGDENSVLIGVSKERGFTYDKDAEVFIGPDKSFAVPNTTQRCRY